MHPNKVGELPENILKVKEYLGKGIEYLYPIPWNPKQHIYARGVVTKINGLDITINDQVTNTELTRSYLNMIDLEVLTDVQMTPATKENAQYAIFHGLKLHNEFFSPNNKAETEEELCRTDDGKISYRIIGYAHTCAEAQVKLYGGCHPKL